MFLKWRLKIRNFFKKYRKVILIVIVVWAVIIAINYYLKNKKEPEVLNTTYTPHEVLLKSDTEVPEKLQTPIEDLIDNYVNKCNSKDYTGAFNLLTEECKTYVFNDSLDNYKEYVDEVFDNEKRYSIQDYSNYGEYYIYNIKIIDNIIKTGLTNQTYAYYEEKIAIKQDGNTLKMSVDDYMDHEDLKKIAEDDYLKIRIESRENYYNSQLYTIRITNKTEKEVVLYDGIASNELAIESENDSRDASTVSATMALEPGETKTFKVRFAKYYDEKTKATNITFNKVRIMNEYTGLCITVCIDVEVVTSTGNTSANIFTIILEVHCKNCGRR